jgi:hypothetical protein
MNEVLSIGLRGMHSGFQSAAENAERVVRSFQDGETDDAVSALIGLRLDQQQVEASARIIETGRQLIGSVLDMYA